MSTNERNLDFLEPFQDLFLKKANEQHETLGKINFALQEIDKRIAAVLKCNPLSITLVRMLNKIYAEDFPTDEISHVNKLASKIIITVNETGCLDELLQIIQKQVSDCILPPAQPFTMDDIVSLPDATLDDEMDPQDALSQRSYKQLTIWGLCSRNTGNYPENEN
jgi:hypothetical protein